MDKKTFLALILIGVIFLLWPVYMKKVVGVPEPVQQAATETVQTESSNTGTLEVTQEPQKTQERRIKASKPSVTAPKSYKIQDYGAAEEVVLENDLFRCVLSSAGGGTVKGWQLKKHLDTNGNWLQLMPDSSAANLGMVIGDPIQRSFDLTSAIFTVALDTQWTENGTHFQKVEFVKNLNQGRIVRQFILRDGDYHVDLTIWINAVTEQEGARGITIEWDSAINPTEPSIVRDLRYCAAFAHQGGDLLKTAVKPTGFREGTTDWVAVRSKYFVVAIIPVSQKGTGASLDGKNIQILRDGNIAKWRTLKADITVPLARNNNEPVKMKVYVGPMDYQRLKSYHVGLEKLMNFGWTIIRPFSIAFYYTLLFLNDIFHNYGWAIIIFAILIKIVLYPLTRKSYQSMHAMQELQPKINALREKYKDNSQKLNEETMKLYKKHGVNPMGGCLPMLLQMPVLFALFNLFRTTIMLRQAPFLGGLIADLSSPDHMLGGINVFPILMSVTMIFQQRLTNKDPKQKMMAYFMPIMMAFIFYKLSAGLNLYYLMFNLLTIGQELLIGKKKTEPQAE